MYVLVIRVNYLRQNIEYVSYFNAFCEYKMRVSVPIDSDREIKSLIFTFLFFDERHAFGLFTGHSPR